MKLEELARQSSDAARAAVVHLDPPALGADARNRGRMPVLLGAAAVLLVVGLGVFLALRDDPTETVTAGSGELPVLGLADPASFGLSLAGMFDPDAMADQAGSEEFDATFVYFGTPGADDPYADGDLLVGELISDEPEPLSEGTPMTVRGGLQASVPGPDSGLPGATTLEWYEPTDDGEVQMVLASDSLDVDQLVAVADSLDLSAGIDEVTFSDEAALPAAIRDLEVVAVDDGFPTLFMFRNPDGPVVAYQRAETISSTAVESVSVSSSAGTLTDSLMADRWWASSAELVDVAGEPAWLLTYEFGQGGDTGEAVVRVHSVAWQWAPGVVAAVSAATTGDSELAVDVAQAVVELDPALLDDAQGEALANQASADLDEVWGSGAGTTDVAGSSAAWAWAIGLQDGQFCTSLFVGSGGSSSCEPLAQLLNRVPDAPIVVGQSGEMDSIQFGVIAAGPDHIVLPAEGTPGELTEVLVPNDADGTRLLVWVGPAGAPARFDALVDGRDPIVLDIGDGVMGVEETEPAEDGDSATEEEAVGVESPTAGAEFDVVWQTGTGADVSSDVAQPAEFAWAVGTQGDQFCAALTGSNGESVSCQPLEAVWSASIAGPVEIDQLDVEGMRLVVIAARDNHVVSTDDRGELTQTSVVDDATRTRLVVWFGPADPAPVFLLGFGGASPATDAAEALSLADLDVAVLASMATEGILVDEVVLPPGVEYTTSEGNGAAQFWRFESEDSESSIAIGVWGGGEDVREVSEDATPVDLDGRPVWVDDFGTEIRIAYPVDGLLVEVVGRNVEVDVLLDVMADIVWLGPVDDSGATPTLEEARGALEGLDFTDALRVATESGWSVLPTVAGRERGERPSIVVPYWVTLTVTEGIVTSVDEVG
jgi:hypothetical protein